MHFLVAHLETCMFVIAAEARFGSESEVHEQRRLSPAAEKQLR